MYKDTLQKVKRFMTETGMLQNCSEIILGVSGGPDSMTMLHILNELRDEFGYRLRVVHVNHGIRGKEALRDQQMVEKICSEWKIPCAVYNYDVPALALSWKMGTEEAGRRGLCSLKPLNGEIIRPLLCLERSEIVNYVEENSIQTVLDSSNMEDDYTRNRIRRHILPLIEQEVNPRAVTHMAEASEIFGQAEAYFTKLAGEMAAGYRKAKDRYVLDHEFFKKETIIQTYVIREILEVTGGHQSDLTSGHIKQIRDLYGMQTGRKADLPYELEASRVYEGVQIRKKNMIAESDSETEELKIQNLVVPGETKWKQGCFTAKIYSYNGEKILEKKYTKWFDCDKINCELTVRTRRSGDYMAVSQSGGHKKLTRCMIDDKIPGELRGKLPLVVDGNEVLWIVGGRINERYKITSETGRVLEITYQGGNVQ